MKKITTEKVSPVNALVDGENVYTTLVRVIYQVVVMLLCISSVVISIVVTVESHVKRLDKKIKS
jgi:hypothetical protein